jgi:hypothetical protein
MRFYCIIAFSFSAACAAQVGSVAIKPVGPPASSAKSEWRDRRVSAAGPPLLGFIAGPAATDLHAIEGQISKPVIGRAIVLPQDTRAVFLPPPQTYVMLESTSNRPPSILPLWGVSADFQQKPSSLTGAMSHPDQVAFSPRGSAAALYSEADGRIQILTNLPAQPSITKNLSLSRQGTPSSIAISDDAAVILAAFPDGRLLVASTGTAWVNLPLAFTPRDWSFLPGTHHLVLSDALQKTIVLFTNVETPARTSQILAQDILADRIAVTKDGGELIAASAASGDVWTIDLTTSTITHKAGIPNIGLLPLRDGFTFLLSSSPQLFVLRLPGSNSTLDPALAQTTSTSAPIQ